METGEATHLDSKVEKLYRITIQRSLDFVNIFPKSTRFKALFLPRTTLSTPKTHFERFLASAYMSRGYKSVFFIEQEKMVNKDVFRDYKRPVFSVNLTRLVDKLNVGELQT